VYDEASSTFHYHGFVSDITERAQETKALQECEEHQRILLENISEGIIYQTADGAIISANQAAKSILGLSFDKIHGTASMDNFRRIIKEDGTEVSETEHPTMIALRTGRQAGPVVRGIFHNSKNTYVWLSITAIPLFRPGETIPFQAFITFKDITAIKQANNALNESDARFRNLLDNIPSVAVQGYGMDGVTLYWNKASEILYGYTAHEAVGQNLVDLIIPDEMRSHVQKEMQYMAQKGKPVPSSELTMKRKDGSFVSVFSSHTIVHKHDGSLELFCIDIDLTELNKAKENLIQSESYYRAIFETSGSAMYIIEEDTTISLANSNFEQLSGYSKYDIEGKKSWTDFAHPDDVQWMKENHYLRRRGLHAAPQSYEFRFLTRSGEVRIGYLTINMIPGTQKSVASLIDITQSKRTEKILQARLRLMEYSLSHSFEKVLRATIDEAENLTDSRIGFYHFLERDQRTISLQTWSTRTTTQACFAQAQEMHYDIDEAGVWVDCIHKAKPIIHNDYASLPDKKGIPKGHPSIIRELVVPVYRGESIKALLGVGNKPQDYTSDDIETVSLLANLAWDIIEQKQMEEKVRTMSLYDPMTGLYNRFFFEEEMQRLSSGRQTPLGVIVADLDGLKFINDSLGHQVGDQMLVTAASILKNNFRSNDILARIGGDEFAVLLPQTSQEAVEQILERLRKEFDAHNRPETEIPLSLSFGYAVSGEETTNIQGLFREADNRMYREKIQREGSTRSAILQALSGTMRARDFDTEGHCDRLQSLAASLGKSLDLSRDLVNDILLLARFHDLGKVGIPDQILFKPGQLTEEEWRQMRKHCEIGHRIAFSVPDLEPIADYILKHHECWDGGGYPLGLQGKDIPLPCRILAIVDAYDAMTSDRPYRKAMTPKKAIDELQRCAGSQFDPDLVDRFIMLLGEVDK
jgi:diguanylate cyclase (GGDEF)-like protein/PAS domain S-box-containing protein